MKRPRNRKERIVAMVPAKIGSTRLAMKNLALVAGKPLVYYAIKAAKDSGVFEKIIVNAEDAVFSAIAKRYGVGFYKRPDAIVSPKTKTDTVVHDFLRTHDCDIVAWVSPIAPFQTGGEIASITDYFVKNGLDSLMTVKSEQVHSVYRDKPVNFRADEIFAQTQDLEPVQAFVYSVMMWRAEPFLKTFERDGYALLCGKVGYYPISKLSSIIIKKEDDLFLADHIMRAMTSAKRYKVRYDPIVKGLVKRGIRTGGIS